MAHQPQIDLSLSLFHKCIKAKLCAAIPPIKEATTAIYTHTLGLKFTMKPWAEFLALMSVIMHGPYLKQTQLLCVIWRYHLWAAFPCLSWSSVAFSRPIGVKLDRDPLCQLSWESFSMCANLKCTYRFVMYGHTQTDRHTHGSCNAVLLVWGSLRLTPFSMF